MTESNQEGYRTLGWILSKSEQGLFLAVAEEGIQKEILNIYRNGLVGIYDYKRHPGEYSFPLLQEWVTTLPQIKTFLIVNFHLALQNENSIKRLNFSRDMLEGLGRNFIFLVPPYMDDRLAVEAYDFYSFLKLRVTFHDYKAKAEKEEELPAEEPVAEEEGGWKPEELKKKMAEAYRLIEEARDEYGQAHYDKSEKLLLKAREIKEKLLGTEHLEIAEINCDLAGVYERKGKYQEAENLYKKSLLICEKILGEEHPDTAASYHNLAGVYESQGKYQEAENLYKKSLLICEKILGEEHPDTAASYHNLAGVYESQGKYQEAENLYKKSLLICEKILGEEHPDTAASYHNLAGVYESQGKYQEAENLYKKSLLIKEKTLGKEHPSTAVSYHNLALVYGQKEEYEAALPYILKAYKIFVFTLGMNHPNTQMAYKNMKTIFAKSNSEDSFEHWLEKKMKEKKISDREGDTQ